MQPTRATEERNFVGETLSSLVPLAVDGAVFERVLPDGARSCVVAVHVDRGRESSLTDASTRPSPSSSVSVRVLGHEVGELLVWRQPRLSAVEEAFVCLAAARIGDQIEKRELVAALDRSGDDANREAFVDLLGHELRAPLQSLTLGLELIRTRIRDSADEVPRPWLIERVDGLGRGVDRLRDLADRVTEMARHDGYDGAAPKRERVDLKDVVARVRARMEDELRWASCSVAIEASQAACDGMWDRLHIETIVSNLFANAVKYGARERIEIQISCDAESATFAIRDHGCGIELVDQPRVFERFFRGHTPSRLPGVGLGLSVVRQLVELHGGEISVASVPGAGATFTVRLPRGESEESDLARPPLSLRATSSQ